MRFVFFQTHTNQLLKYKVFGWAVLLQCFPYPKPQAVVEFQLTGPGFSWTSLALKRNQKLPLAKIWGIFSACGCSVSASQLLGPWTSTGVWCLFWHRCHFSQNTHRLRKKSRGEREEKIVSRKNFGSEIKSKSTLLFLKKWRSAEVKTLQNSDISSEVDLNYSILRSLNAPRTVSLVFWFIESHCLCCILALSFVWQQILLHPPWRPALFSCIHFLCV